MPTTSNPLILPMLFAIFGFIFGALVATLVTGRGKNDEGELPPGLDPERHQVLARLWRDRKSGSIMTEVDHSIHTNPKTLSPEQLKGLRALQRDWGLWLGVKPEAAPVPLPVQPVPVSPAAPVLSPVPAPVVQAVPVQPAAVQPMLVPTPAAPVTQPAPAVPMPAVISTPPAASNSEPKPSDKPTTMVQQIDAILQEVLASSNVANKGIRLVDDPRQGVVVWVGFDHYVGIDSVPDPEVQKIIRAAVAEWEKRSEKDPRWSRNK
jgi:hypothetical protein